MAGEATTPPEQPIWAASVSWSSVTLPGTPTAIRIVSGMTFPRSLPAQRDDGCVLPHHERRQQCTTEASRLSSPGSRPRLDPQEDDHQRYTAGAAHGGVTRSR